jgi:hypothetical protein
MGVPLLLLPLGLLPAAAAALEPASSAAAAAAATGTGMMLPLGLHSSWKVTVLPTEGDVTSRTYSSSSSTGTRRLKRYCFSSTRVLEGHCAASLRQRDLSTANKVHCTAAAD